MNLTVIVPFYNAEAYVEKFYQSIKRQSNHDVHCLFVDDGSLDESPMILRTLIQNDKTCSLLSLDTNKGPGNARARGIEVCTSEYVSFLDIDDEISDDAFAVMNEEIEKHPEIDVFVYDYLERRKTKDPVLITTKAKSIRELFDEDSALICHLVNKVIRTSLLKKTDLHTFSELSFAEDLFLCVDLFLQKPSILFVHKPFYTYLLNQTSCTTSRSEKSFYDNATTLCLLLSKCEQYSNNSAIYDYIRRDCFNAFGQFVFPNMHNKFQRRRPHFSFYRSLPIDKVLMPHKLSRLTRAYLSLIRKKYDLLAYGMWLLFALRLAIRDCFSRRK